MAFIDSSVLTVALPSLRTAFSADLYTIQWVMNGYLLALAALSLIGGALGDAYGKARILAIGRLLFGMGKGLPAQRQLGRLWRNLPISRGRDWLVRRLR